MEENKNLMEMSIEGLKEVETEIVQNVEVVDIIPTEIKFDTNKVIAGALIGGAAIGLGALAYYKLVKPSKGKVKGKFSDKVNNFKEKRKAKKNEEPEVIEVEAE